jgi:hypothetical protein
MRRYGRPSGPGDLLPGAGERVQVGLVGSRPQHLAEGLELALSCAPQHLAQELVAGAEVVDEHPAPPE